MQAAKNVSRVSQAAIDTRLKKIRDMMLSPPRPLKPTNPKKLASARSLAPFLMRV